MALRVTDPERRHTRRSPASRSASCNDRHRDHRPWNTGDWPGARPALCDCVDVRRRTGRGLRPRGASSPCQRRHAVHVYTVAVRHGPRDRTERHARPGPSLRRRRSRATTSPPRSAAVPAVTGVSEDHHHDHRRPRRPPRPPRPRRPRQRLRGPDARRFSRTEATTTTTDHRGPATTTTTVADGPDDDQRRWPARRDHDDRSGAGQRSGGTRGPGGPTPGCDGLGHPGTYVVIAGLALMLGGVAVMFGERSKRAATR